MHPECKNFVVANGGICSYWKSTVKMYGRGYHDCYVKGAEIELTAEPTKVPTKMPITNERFEYTLHANHHCGPDDIRVWADGTPTQYGSGELRDLESCKATCDRHPECKNFVVANGGICSYWKSTVKMYGRGYHDCYVKGAVQVAVQETNNPTKV